MSDNHVLREWEEIVISHEKGRRIVHYILKDSTGNSLLAVVGKDRSVNHLSYAVTEDYLRVFGPTSTVHAGTRWQAKRDVVRWLMSVVSSGGPIFANSINHSSHECQVSTEEVAVCCRKMTKSCHADRTHVVSDDGVIKCEPHLKRLKIKVSSEGPAKFKVVMPEPKGRLLSENVELLSKDSGLQGCWFRCKILHSSQDLLKVQYKDVLEVDGSGKLEEWVPASRVAGCDKLSMRCVGRLRVRPRPCEDHSDTTFVVGDAVDAWWCNGWWEGVVIGYEHDARKTSNLQVYFPGENRFLTVARKHIRVSRDWIDDKWVGIKAKPDILDFLSSVFSTGPKLPPLPSSSETYSSPVANSSVINPTKLEKSEDDKQQEVENSSPSAANVRAVQELNFKKRLISRYNVEMSEGNYCSPVSE